jgi:hypothetical protein
MATVSISAVATGQTTATLSWSISGVTVGQRPWTVYFSGSGSGIDTVYSQNNSGSSGTLYVSGLSAGASYSWVIYSETPTGTPGPYLTSNTVTTDAVPTYPPVWTDNTLGGFQAGVAYSDSVSATNSPTYSVYSGALPSGISRSGGVLSGTPTVAGESYSFVLRATNGDGFVSASFSGTVAAAPTAGKIKVWNGTAWVYGPVKVWNGTTWVAGPVKVWTGTVWVTSV